MFSRGLDLAPQGLGTPPGGDGGAQVYIAIDPFAPSEPWTVARMFKSVRWLIVFFFRFVHPRYLEFFLQLKMDENVLTKKLNGKRAEKAAVALC